MNPRHWITLGAVLAALAIGMGAFGAHALRSRFIPPGETATAESLRLLEIFETAARYQMYHALALVLVGLLAERRHSTAWQASGGLFAVGILLFCGSLYALVLTGIKQLGAITPLGGASFILGWLALAFGAGKKK